MPSIANSSREILERVFYYTTALHDTLDEEKGSPYYSGEFLPNVEKRSKEVRGNLQNRGNIMHVCRFWRHTGLKYRFEFLKIDAKSSDAWVHANRTLTTLAAGRHIKRLELDAFDSSFIRVRAAAGILKQCSKLRYVTLTFADDSRRSLRSYNLLVPAILKMDPSSLEHLSCNLGRSFAQTALFEKFPDFSNLRSISLDSAFGIEKVKLYDTVPLYLAQLQHLRVTSTETGLLRLLSKSILPSLRDVSVHQLLSSKTHLRFFKAHGYKIRTLELDHIAKDSSVSTVLSSCPFLEELTLSLDGVPYSLKHHDISFALLHSTVKRIGIRDVAINHLVVGRTMEVLDVLIRRFTRTSLFPKLREIRLMDFHRELWVNVPWISFHADIWLTWMEDLGAAMIQLQASDGISLSISSDGPIRLLDTEDEENWLFKRCAQMISRFGASAV